MRLTLALISCVLFLAARETSALTIQECQNAGGLVARDRSSGVLVCVSGELPPGYDLAPGFSDSATVEEDVDPIPILLPWPSTSIGGIGGRRLGSGAGRRTPVRTGQSSAPGAEGEIGEEERPDEDGQSEPCKVPMWIGDQMTDAASNEVFGPSPSLRQAAVGMGLWYGFGAIGRALVAIGESGLPSSWGTLR